MRYLLVALALLAIGAVSVGMGLSGSPADRFPVTDVSAMRITPHTAKRLAVYRITCGGNATDLPAGTEPAASVVRVDFELNGKHVTVWARDD